MLRLHMIGTLTELTALGTSIGRWNNLPLVLLRSMGMLFYDDEPIRRRKSFSVALKRELHKKQGGKCMYCGRKPGIDLMDVDHKNPMAKGGSDQKRNLQLLCRSCNIRKGATTDRQFRTKFKSIGVPQTQVPPTTAIPQSKFAAVAKTTASKKARQSRTRRRREDDWFF